MTPAMRVNPDHADLIAEEAARLDGGMTDHERAILMSFFAHVAAVVRGHALLRLAVALDDAGDQALVGILAAVLGGRFQGYAGQPIEFAGYVDDFDRTICAMEFSLDDGASWTAYPTAAVDKSRGVNWRFVYTPETPGRYLLKVR